MLLQMVVGEEEGRKRQWTRAEEDDLAEIGAEGEEKMIFE